MTNLTNLLSEAKRIAQYNGLGQWLGSRLIITSPARGVYAGIVQGIRPENQFNTFDAAGNLITKLPPTGNEYYMPDGSILINIAKAISPNGDFWGVGYKDSYQIYTTSSLTILKVGSSEWYNTLKAQGFSTTILGDDPNVTSKTVSSYTSIVETYPNIPKIPEGYTGALRETQVVVGGKVQTITVPIHSPTQSIVINGTRIDVPKEEAQNLINSGIATTPIDTTITKIGENVRVSKGDPTFIIETDIIPTDVWVFAGDKWNHVVNGKVIESQTNAPEIIVRGVYPSLPPTSFDSGVPSPQVIIPKTEISSITITPKVKEDVDDIFKTLMRSDYYNIPNWFWLSLVVLIIVMLVGVKLTK